MDKSKGHLAFVGRFEFWQLNGYIRRSTLSVTYIGRDGYRTGGRLQGPMSQKDYILDTCREWEEQR